MALVGDYKLLANNSKQNDIKINFLATNDGLSDYRKMLPRGWPISGYPMIVWFPFGDGERPKEFNGKPRKDPVTGVTPERKMYEVNYEGLVKFLKD